MDLKVFEKGQVWLTSNDKWTPEQREAGITVGDRPVIIYRTVEVKTKFVTAIPTSAGNPDRKNGVRLSLENDTNSIALVQEIRPIPINCLTTFLGTLSQEKMAEIDNAMMVYFGLMSDTDITKTVFPIQASPRPIIHSRDFPAPKVPVINQEPVRTQSTVEEKVVKTKPVEEVVNEEPISTDDDNDKRKKRNTKTYKDYTEYDKDIIFSHNIEEVSDMYNLSKSAIYRYRKMIDTERKEQHRIYDYSLKVYKGFDKKNLNLLNSEEKKLFLKLDPERLSKVIAVPIETINELRIRFANQLNFSI